MFVGITKPQRTENSKEEAKVVIKNKLRVDYMATTSSFEVVRPDSRYKDKIEVLAVVDKYGYKIKEKESFTSVDFEKFTEYMEANEYKRPIASWSGENKVLFSLKDYENGIIKDGDTFSIALNELYDKLGYELAVIDIDLKGNSKEVFDIATELAFELSEIRILLKTPNGYHIILKRSEYEKFLERYGISDNDLKTLANSISILGHKVNSDVFRTWKDVRYILIPTKHSVRELLGGGVVSNRKIIQGNTLKDILEIFKQIHESEHSDEFLNVLFKYIKEVNDKDELVSIQNSILNENQQIKRGALSAFCKEIGVKNLRDYDIKKLCDAIRGVGDVDGTGRYSKILKYFFYYITTKLVLHTKDYKDMVANYRSVDIYKNDENLEVYNALKVVYKNEAQLKLRANQFIHNINQMRDRIATKMYETVYDAIKKHIYKKKTSFTFEYDKIIATREDTLTSLAEKFASRGIRKYSSNIVVDGPFYYTIDQFKKGNRHINRAIPDSLSHFHVYLPSPVYNHNGKKYTNFVVIPEGRVQFYDKERKTRVMFVKDYKSKLYCVAVSEDGVKIEKVDDLDRPIFFRYYISYNDYVNYKSSLKSENIKEIWKVIKDVNYARQKVEEATKLVFDYYTLNTKTEKNDEIVKKSIVASMCSDEGLILQLIGGSGVGKTVLALGLAIFGSFREGASVLTLSDNAEEDRYRLLQSLYEGRITVLDEIPKQLDIRTQRNIFSIVASTVNEHRMKYSRETVTIHEQAKLITTSLDVPDWAADARRRSIIVSVARAGTKRQHVGLNPAREYHNNIEKIKTIAKIAIYSLVRTTTLTPDEIQMLAQTGSMPDSIKGFVGKFIKAMGYSIKEFIDAFDDTNQSHIALQPLYLNLLEMLSQENVRNFIKNKPDIFPYKNGWYDCKTTNLLRLAYAYGLVKTHQSEEFFYVLGKIPLSMQKFTPSADKFEETFMNLIDKKIVDDINFQEIDDKLVALSKSQSISSKLQEFAVIPNPDTLSFGVEIMIERNKDSRKLRNLLKFKFVDIVDTPPDTPTNTPPPMPPSAPTPNDTPLLPTNELSDIDSSFDVDERGYPKFWDEPISMTTTDTAPPVSTPKSIQKSVEYKQETETTLAIAKDMFDISADEEPDARVEMLSVYVSVLHDMLCRDVSMYKNPRKAEEQALNVVLSRIQKYSTFRYLREDFEKYLDSIKKECITVVPPVKILSADEANRLLSKYNTADGLEKFFKSLNTTKLNNVERYVATVLFVVCMYNYNKFLKNGKVDSFLVPELLVDAV